MQQFCAVAQKNGTVRGRRHPKPYTSVVQSRNDTSVARISGLQSSYKDHIPTNYRHFDNFAGGRVYIQDGDLHLKFAVQILHQVVEQALQKTWYRKVTATVS